jgi:hypothetical protein
MFAGHGSFASLFVSVSYLCPMIDNTQASNPIRAGINKSLPEEIGAMGDALTPTRQSTTLAAIRSGQFGGAVNSSCKFTRQQGQGPNEKDGG